MTQLTLIEDSKNSHKIDLHLRNIYARNLKAINSFIGVMDDLPRFDLKSTLPKEQRETRKTIESMRNHAILACLITIQEEATACLEFKDEIPPELLERLKIKELSALGSMLIVRYSAKNWQAVVTQFLLELYPIIYPEYEEIFESEDIETPKETTEKKIEKVRVSKELSEAVESGLRFCKGDKDRMLNMHIKKYWQHDKALLNTLSQWELAKILIKGYEVE